MTREEKKQEAIERMKLLRMHENVIREFREEDKLNLSENGGLLYWLDDNQREVVKDFEQRHNAVVYHVIHNFAEFGELLSLLYVSDAVDEWEMDRQDLKENTTLAYVRNLDDDMCSEFGYIGIKPKIGGIVRIN